MSNIDKIAQQAKNPGDFAKRYFNYLNQILDTIDPTPINLLVEVLEEARLKENTIFIIGNGGSASTASTMANDLGFDVIKKTEVNKPFRILSLTDNTSVMSAIANDVGYENIFLNQLRIHYRNGDKLLAISASGNSPNVITAAEWVRAQGGSVLSFVGFQGGKLKEISDIVIHVKTNAGEYGPVEDAHLILNHILAHWFQFKLK